MPGWFIALLVASLAGFLASWSGDLVLATSILTFGLMLPVWFVAANLWWVLLALMPFMILRQSGKGAIGLAIGVGAMVALGVGASVNLGAARTALTPALPLPAAGLAREAGVPGSVELAVLSSQGWDASEEACGGLCRSLLTGEDIAWFRLSVAGPAASETVVFARADQRDCLAFDPAFPADAPCLLAREDDGASADLRIEITGEGDFHAPMTGDHGAVYLTGVQRLTLTDNRAAPEKVLDERLRYAWSQPVIGPLFTAMTALGSGAKSDGPSFKRVRRESGPFDLAAILAHAGLRMGPVPAAADVGGQPSMPVETALLASILTLVDDGTLSRGQAKMARDWALRFYRSPFAKAAAPKVGDAERRVFQQLAKLQGDSELEPVLASMLGEHPEYFVEDFGALLRVIVTGTAEEARKASKAAVFGLFRADRGDHDAAWPDYVAAVESGRAGEDLIRWVGKFNQDPVPLLRGQLARTPRHHAAWAALQAVCHVDERWWPDLIRLLQDAALGYLPAAGDTEMNGMEIHHAVRGLVLMGRRDLAVDVVGRIDWSLVSTMPDWAENPARLVRYRESMAELPDQPQGC